MTGRDDRIAERYLRIARDASIANRKRMQCLVQACYFGHVPDREDRQFMLRVARASGDGMFSEALADEVGS